MDHKPLSVPSSLCVWVSVCGERGERKVSVFVGQVFREQGH